IPEIAYGHHEKLDGKGYPRQIAAPELPIQTRMMTISDIYDALTASDRPYKKAVPASKALDILGSEAKEGKLDSALLHLFIDAKVYERTARDSPGPSLRQGLPLRFRRKRQDQQTHQIDQGDGTGRAAEAAQRRYKIACEERTARGEHAPGVEAKARTGGPEAGRVKFRKIDGEPAE